MKRTAVKFNYKPISINLHFKMFAGVPAPNQSPALELAPQQPPALLGNLPTKLFFRVI